MLTRNIIWLVNATRDDSHLPEISARAREAGVEIHSLKQPGEIPPLPDGAEVHFLPCSPAIDWRQLAQLQPLGGPDCIQPLTTPPQGSTLLAYTVTPVDWFGWRAGAALAHRILGEPAAWRDDGIDLMEAIQQWRNPPRWQSIPLDIPAHNGYTVSAPAPVLSLDSRVLVVISHFHCEQWLHGCLHSIQQQTRPPENIVVIDDCSGAPPVDLLEPFPDVTLLSTTRNVGPEKILNNIIFATDYDGYMVQDPDDWSACDRLESCLRAAENTGARLVGTHEIRVDLQRHLLKLCAYPMDVNHAMRHGGGESWGIHHLLHGASLISRALAMDIGGFDENLKLCADTDFCIRAWYTGPIVNAPALSFYRRVREGSLTQQAGTGYKSVKRTIESKYVELRAKKYLASFETGNNPGIAVIQKDPVQFTYLRGPKLRLAHSADARIIGH